ncbi:MAG: 1-deoxy-D-xylulose-5-phosphate synthase [Coriobacteriaceae bacterium]|jgi:1-deoxy-D-xylulose-5-phosphate synthase|nr:1-deoxy-D-xylulose-5-phosphate synthase [Coriobacteriaceae bacterium]
MSDRILDIIGGPGDLKCLTVEELDILAGEIREEIVSVTAQKGGHLASSLGTVEIICALYSLLDAPPDKIVFDVGHQAYAHKLVTGRLKEFSSLRCYGGISGFCRPGESPFDVHYSGHASDSLSIASGLAKARDLKGGTERVVALIGDASLAGGMAFEALNQIGHDQTRMIIVLNDNEMSISHNVGALMKHFGYMRASSQYRNTRDSLQEMLERRGRVGKGIANFGRNVKESMKHFVIPRSMIFEQLGILCTAPIDGHDIAALRETFKNVMDTQGPVLVHVVTKKGAGYAPAEAFPERFHGVGPFDIKTGELKKPKASAPTYTEVFSQAMLAEASVNDDIVALTAAMKDGTGLTEFAERFPERFVDVGIAEEHALGMASGLAIGGKKPVVAIYSTFMQRAIDQLIVDNALPGLDLVLCLDRAGLVGDDGPTHHGVFDLAYARMVPHLQVLAPSDEAELVHALHTALALGGPFAIRYPRGTAEGVPLPEAAQVFKPGESRMVREGSDVAILAFGRMVKRATEAATLLEKDGIGARVVDMRWAKPLDADAIKAAASTQLVVTVEEGVLKGGVGEGVLEVLSNQQSQVRTLCLGIPDAFMPQGKVELLLRDCALDAEGIAAAIRARLGS